MTDESEGRNDWLADIALKKFPESSDRFARCQSACIEVRDRMQQAHDKEIERLKSRLEAADKVFAMEQSEPVRETFPDDHALWNEERRQLIEEYFKESSK